MSFNVQSIFGYLGLGAQVLNAATTIIALVKTPAELDAATVWTAVEPVVVEVGIVAKISINMDLAKKISDDAVASIKAARIHPVPVVHISSGTSSTTSGTSSTGA